MREIRAVFFWLSGVYTQPFISLAAQALNQTGGRAINPLALPQYAALIEQLVIGQIDGYEFCQRIGESAGIASHPSALADAILGSVTPSPVALTATGLLPTAFQRWLVVDLPVDWFESLAGRLGLGDCFSPEKRIFLPTSRLPQLIPDVFYHMAYCAQLPIQECLLIDASARRAVQALRHGLSTEIFLDGRQLERAFILRKFISRPHPVHKPDTLL